MGRQFFHGEKAAGQKIISFCLAVFMSAALTACGGGIREETKQAVRDRTSQALQLYNEIEKTVREKHLTADSVFADVKAQLTDMSEQVQAGLEDATEEDGQETIRELDALLRNLQSVKDGLE